jgi:hypothetical protein
MFGLIFLCILLMNDSHFIIPGAACSFISYLGFRFQLRVLSALSPMFSLLTSLCVPFDTNATVSIRFLDIQVISCTHMAHFEASAHVAIHAFTAEVRDAPLKDTDRRLFSHLRCSLCTAAGLEDYPLEYRQC